MSGGVEGLLAFVVLLTVGLPTFMFYGWIVLFGWLAARQMRPGRSKLIALLCAAAAVASLGWYGAVYSADLQRNQALADVVRAAPVLPRLAPPPRVLVVHRGHIEWQDRLIEMGAFDEIYLVWQGKKTRLANARRAGCDTGTGGNHVSKNTLRARTGYLVCATETEVAAVPTEGLHLSLTPPPPTRRNQPSDWERVYDLKWIEGGVEKQVGFHGSPRVSVPIVPPVLSTLGFLKRSDTLRHIVPWYGDVEFLVERLGIEPDQLKPLAQPSPENIRAEFLRRRDSAERADQHAAAFIAEAVGSFALTAEDIAPLLTTNVVDTDLARELGFQQFCGHIDRLCDFKDALIPACKAQRAHLPAIVSYRPDALRRCERIPEMCNWCRTAQLCQPYLTGQRTGCSNEETQARDAALRELRGN